ncbi:SMI1/KNR4 family protein [Corallococcus exiguus]|uniref:SMI1/KNR4 family protein n=1 Tax=Corallococcus TaxID=83461 RepID=UPI000EA0A797|nr:MULTISPECIES: SMI1/KNR4 family protein [Corallococcus]NRD57606.1 SMI1/KNR4 family protein [Corallococcus exiguus]NRD64215.1 SMI1/KNR4 family protein [Corallococcus exiguus]RKH22971.1 SMI1/KNR4 family protein [Corallococcus sp. CA041A]
MDSLLAEASRLHFPRPPATLAQVSDFEARLGWKLDEDLRAFYLHCDGCDLFVSSPDTRFRILPLAQIMRARVAIRGKDRDEAGAASLYTLVDMQDSDYLVLDVARSEAGRYPLFDAWHETFPELVPVASSFGEFLEKALHSGNRAFWLSSGPMEE